MLCSDVPPDVGPGEVALSLHISEETCVCGAALGRHRAACPRSGLLKIRAKGPERTLARVCREAGASVRFNAKLRERASLCER